MAAPVITPELRRIFATYDGSLPDINFDFARARVVAEAYALVQSRATILASEDPCYWSKTERRDCKIQFGDNPAERLLAHDVDPFHVVFGGLKSRSGHAIPDLGIFALAADAFTVDYRMGPEWTDDSITGLLEIMTDLARLAPNTAVSHEGNDFDPHGRILLSAFRQCRELAIHRTHHSQL